MLFSVNFKSKRKSLADEVRCPYNQLGRLYEFIKNNPDKRYLIEIPETPELDMDKLIEQVTYVKAIAPYTISSGKIGLAQSLIKNGYNAFLRFPVTDWETFSDLQTIGVSDIYVDGPLGFQQDKLQKTKKEIKLRTSPTISPNASIKVTRPITSFFIRPEDLPLFSSFDIVDFKETDEDKEQVLFDIYKRGTFNFKLNRLVKGLDTNVENPFITSDFAKNRLNCGQRCRIPGYSCHLCPDQMNLSSTIRRNIDEMDRHNKSGSGENKQ